MNKMYPSTEKCRQYMRSTGSFRAILDQVEQEWNGGSFYKKSTGEKVIPKIEEKKE